MGKNLLSPGNGTPWEDRGSISLPVAYFKTVFSMLFSPSRTVDQIKRVDSRKDASSFVFVSAIWWFLSAWIHTLIHYRILLKSIANQRDVYINIASYFTRAFFGSLILSGGIILMFNIASKIYYGMVRGQDMKGRGSLDLIYNVYAYSMATSILAIIPFIGPPAAIIWGYILTIISGINRLRVKPGGAATAATFSLVAGLLVVGAALALGYFIWFSLFGDPIIRPES